MTTPDCPGSDVLASYADGTLEEQALLHLERHREYCDACDAALRSLESQPGEHATRKLPPGGRSMPLDGELADADSTSPAAVSVSDNTVAFEDDESACPSPAIPVGTTPLVSLLLQSRLISQEQLDTLPKPRAGDEAALTAELLRRGLVNGWQLTQLRAGRTTFFLENDRYLLLDQIGQGGMGSVYRARHTRMGRDVALKVIDPRRVPETQAIERFRREVQVSSRLRHEHIVQAYDVGEHEGTSFLALEHVEGSDLAALVRRDGPMAPDEAAAIGLQAASALAYAHAQGIIHRDIKPQNILLSTEGVTKVLDLGLARIVENTEDSLQTGLTQDGSVMGTVDFMPPEQARDAHRADGRSDIYALGATLYFLLTGRRPYQGGSVLEKLHRLANEEPTPLGLLRPDCPRELSDVIERMMARRPEDRFQTAEDVVRALRPLAAERIAGRPAVTASVQTAAEMQVGRPTLPDDQPPMFTFEQPALSALRRRPRRAPTLSVGSLAVATILAAGLGLLIWRSVSDTHPAAMTVPAATASAAKMAGPPDGIRVEMGGHFVRNAYSVSSVAFSSDEQFLATGGFDGDVRIWNAQDGKLVCVYSRHHSNIVALAWSADGTQIASAEHLGEVHVWHPRSGAPSARFERSYDDWRTRGLAFSPDGTELCYSEPARVVRWNMRRKQPVWSSEPGALHITYSRNGELLAVGTEEGRIVGWERTSGEQVFQFSPDETERCVPVFLPDGTLAIARPGTIDFWDVRSRIRRRQLKTPLPRTGGYRDLLVQIAPSARECVLITERGLEAIDLDSGESRVSPVSVSGPPQGGYGAAESLIISPNLRLTARHIGNNVEIHRMHDGRRLHELPVYRFGTHFERSDHIQLLAGRFLVIDASCWDLQTGRYVHNFPATAQIDEAGRLRSVAEDRILHWPDGPAGPWTLLTTLEDASSYIRGPSRLPLTWTPDGKRLYALSTDGRAFRMWDAESGKIIDTASFETSPLNRCARTSSQFVNPTGDVLVLEAPRVQVWRETLEEPAQTISAVHTRALALSPDGQRIVTGAAFSGNVHVWSAEDGRQLASLDTGFIAGLHPLHFRFSPSGQYLLLTRQIWNLDGPELLWECPERDRAVIDGTKGRGEAGEWFPDERHVLIFQDAQYQVWDWRENNKKLTLHWLPGDKDRREWVLINHETGHWSGSVLAFRYLRLRHRDDKNGEQWLTPGQYEKQTGWKTDPAQAGLRLTPSAATE